MPFVVFLTADAARDLEELYQYIALHDAPGKAEHVLTGIEKVLGSLSESPDRGAYPNELLALEIRDYREIFFKSYRVVYRVLGNVVHVLLNADGRRDMQTLLQRRLLDA
ncbi:MAG: type II toxin-antitoxin system RelE/ParE family toxin [Deltaproteobacteria bacterium]|nr:type II toxin-antitoxin system RelE/ParE family toxin [Deltaproteobacteria bacterium]